MANPASRTCSMFPDFPRTPASWRARFPAIRPRCFVGALSSPEQKRLETKQLPILPCFAQFSVDPVGHPVRIPPLDRVDHPPADQQREVEVVAAGQAGRVAAADLLSARDG